MALSQQVEKFILDTISSSSCCPSLHHIATNVGLSERTLRRRLRNEGTTLRQLVERARLSLIEQLPHDSLEGLAEALGYAEARSVSNLVKRNSRAT